MPQNEATTGLVTGVAHANCGAELIQATEASESRRGSLEPLVGVQPLVVSLLGNHESRVAITSPKPMLEQPNPAAAQGYARWSPSAANGRRDSRRYKWRLKRIGVPASRPPDQSVTSGPLCVRPSTPKCCRRRREPQELPGRRTRGTSRDRTLLNRAGTTSPQLGL